MLIGYYHAIEAASMRMLIAAQQQDWEEMLRQQEACTVHIEQLRSAAQGEELSPAQRRERSGIMQRILANDAQIRLLTEPWMEQLEGLLNGQLGGSGVH